MISKWMAKAVVQKSISFLPAKEKINYWFQKNITKGALLSDSYFEFKITHAKDHLKFFRKHSISPLSKCEVLELGTGWYPIVPIMFFLNDIKAIHSIDLRNWMTKENIIITCQKFIEWDQSGKLEPYLENINIGNWEIGKLGNWEIGKLGNYKTNSGKY